MSLVLKYHDSGLTIEIVVMVVSHFVQMPFPYNERRITNDGSVFSSVSFMLPSMADACHSSGVGVGE